MSLRYGLGRDFSLAGIRASHVFNSWYERTRKAGITISHVYVSEAFRWGDVSEPRMLMLRVDASLNGRKLDPCVFLRGDTVCVVPTLLCHNDSEIYGVLVSQPRLAGAQSIVIDWPSGMVEASDFDGFAGAFRELLEETGTADMIEWEMRPNVSELFTGSSEPMGVSEGGSDEGATFYSVHGVVSFDVLNKLHKSIAGAQAEGERTQVEIVSWDAIPRKLAQGGRACAKAALGWFLTDRAMSLGH